MLLGTKRPDLATIFPAERQERACAVRERKKPGQQVGANIERLTYDEKRLALTSLGVEVRIFKHGATDASGQPLDRWEMTMQPAPSAESIVLRASCSASEGPTCGGRR
jgi:hypothetical protein